MITKFIRNQPALKLLSLGMALFLWFFVRSERKLETNLVVNIEVINIPEGLIVSKEFETILQVRVLGPTSTVEKLRQNHSLTYKLDVAEARRGSNTFWIHEDNLDLPYGVKVVQAVPQLIKLYLDRSVEKQVAIVPKFIGSLEYGFKLEAFEVSPSVVKIRGTQDQLQGVEKISTIPVSLTGRRKSFLEEVKLETVEKFLGLETYQVELDVKISENKVTKRIENIPVLLIPSDTKWDVDPKQVTILATGMAGVLADMDKNLEPFVDLSKVEKLPRSVIWVQPRIKTVKGIEFKIVPERLEAFSATKKRR